MLEVAVAAAIPALLYYLALFVQVDLEAARRGLAGLPRADLPRLRVVMRRGWVFLVPLGVLVYTLMVASWNAGTGGHARGGRDLPRRHARRRRRGPTWAGVLWTPSSPPGARMLDLDRHHHAWPAS